MLARNRIRRPFGTFFKHASTFNKILSIGHWAPRCSVHLPKCIVEVLSGKPEHGLLIPSFAKRSASADGFSSRTIEIAIGGTAYPNSGFCGRCVEACSHAFARCSAESREGVGDAEDAVFNLRDRLDAARLRNRHFHLGIRSRSAQYAERCDEEDDHSHGDSTLDQLGKPRPQFLAPKTNHNVTKLSTANPIPW